MRSLQAGKTPLRAGVPNKGTAEVARGAGRAARRAGEPPGAPRSATRTRSGAPFPAAALPRVPAAGQGIRVEGRGRCGFPVGTSNTSLHKQKGCLRKKRSVLFIHAELNQISK